MAATARRRPRRCLVLGGGTKRSVFATALADSPQLPHGRVRICKSLVQPETPCQVRTPNSGRASHSLLRLAVVAEAVRHRRNQPLVEFLATGYDEMLVAQTYRAGPTRAMLASLRRTGQRTATTAAATIRSGRSEVLKHQRVQLVYHRSRLRHHCRCCRCRPPSLPSLGRPILSRTRTHGLTPPKPPPLRRPYLLFRVRSSLVRAQSSAQHAPSERSARCRQQSRLASTPMPLPSAMRRLR